MGAEAAARDSRGVGLQATPNVLRGSTGPSAGAEAGVTVGGDRAIGRSRRAALDGQPGGTTRMEPRGQPVQHVPVDAHVIHKVGDISALPGEDHFRGIDAANRGAHLVTGSH